jgi:hypothetical protein
VSNFVQTPVDNLAYAGGVIFSGRKIMFTVEQCRAKATEYSKLLTITSGPDEMREYRRLERSFTELADNAQWSADNYDKTVHTIAPITLSPLTQTISQQ